MISMFQTEGRGHKGTVEDRRADSRAMASANLPRLQEYKEYFAAAGNIYGIPPVVLAAICSRETNGKNIIGDGGHGHGLMQIDDRYHGIARTHRIMEPAVNIEYAASLLKSYLDVILVRFSAWSRTMCLRGAVSAYNAGLDNVRSWEGLDVGTTGNDYSSDVWEQARFLDGKL